MGLGCCGGRNRRRLVDSVEDGPLVQIECDHVLNPLESVAVLDGTDGDGDVEADARVIQWVNLPQSDDYATIPGVRNTDRLGPQVLVKVRFEHATREHFSITMRAGVGNAAYTLAEAGKADYAGPPAVQLAARHFRTGRDGTAIIAFDLPPAGGNLYTFEASDGHGNTETSPGVKTARHIYYKNITMRDAQVDIDWNAINAEFQPRGVRMLGLDDAQIDTIVQVSDDDAMLASARTAYRADRNTERFAACTIAVVGIVRSWAYRQESKVQMGVRVGPAQPDIVVTIIPDVQLRGRIWYGMNDGIDWFVRAEFTPEAVEVADEVLEEAEERQAALDLEFEALDELDGDAYDREEARLEALQHQIDVMRGQRDPIPIPKARCALQAAGVDDERRTRVVINAANVAGEVLRGTLTLTVHIMSHTRAGFAYPNSNLVCMATEMLGGVSSRAKQTSALMHEIGHKLGMVPNGTGLDRGAHYYAMRGHTGHHCHFDLSDDEAPAQHDQIDYDRCQPEHHDEIECVMFGYNLGLQRFCDTCREAIRKQNLATLALARF